MITLDAAWEQCIGMWTWIVENWSKDLEIYEIKEMYLREQMGMDTSKLFAMSAHNDCFFCQYQNEHGNEQTNPTEKLCKNCPARLVEPTFTCVNSRWHYANSPAEFLNKIKELRKLVCT